MKTPLFNREKFSRTPIIGILRKLDISVLGPVLQCYCESGLTTIEITMNSPGATTQIRYAADQFGDQLNIGAGTVRNVNELRKALDAGAGFIVTPNTDETVVSTCKENNIPVFPGALTPTEIYRAYSLGADMVKVFPASTMGPDYFKSVQGPLDTIPLIATGGINLNNMTSYLEAGATGLGIGSTLFDKQMIARKDWKALQTHMAGFMRTLKSLNP